MSTHARMHAVRRAGQPVRPPSVTPDSAHAFMLAFGRAVRQTDMTERMRAFGQAFAQAWQQAGQNARRKDRTHD